MLRSDGWLFFQALLHVGEWYGIRLCEWYELKHPEPNPDCNRTMLCERRGGHRSGCFNASLFQQLRGDRRVLRTWQDWDNTSRVMATALIGRKMRSI
jgi:hypothetical protein